MSTTIRKKSTAGNGKFSYKYTDLATIHEELEAQGITYNQYIEYNENAGADYIMTVIHQGDKDQTFRGARVISAKALTGGNIAQQYGAMLTYIRRYSLLMALGWACEDDDAESIVIKPSTSQEKALRVDFDEVRSHIQTIETEDELNKYWVSLHLTEKQQSILKSSFAKRKAEIGV